MAPEAGRIASFGDTAVVSDIIAFLPARTNPGRYPAIAVFRHGPVPPSGEAPDPALPFPETFFTTPLHTHFPPLASYIYESHLVGGTRFSPVPVLL